MIDFYEQQQKILDFTKNGFSAFLEQKGLESPAIFTSDALDLDKYKAAFCAFADFASYNIEPLSSDSRNAKLTFDLYFVKRNADAPTLKKQLLAITSAFYAWFYGEDESENCNRCFSGLTDWSDILEINFYDVVSGSQNIKIAQITINSSMEI